MPIRGSAISVSDGTLMNHAGMRMSLVSREVVADSVELFVRAHGYDALVGVAGCDKTLPGMLMGMVRVNVPGPAPGRLQQMAATRTQPGAGATEIGRLKTCMVDEFCTFVYIYAHSCTIKTPCPRLPCCSSNATA